MPQQGEVVSASVKKIQNKVQTNLVVRSPDEPTDNHVFIAYVDEETNDVSVIN